MDPNLNDRDDMERGSDSSTSSNEAVQGTDDDDDELSQCSSSGLSGLAQEPDDKQARESNKSDIEKMMMMNMNPQSGLVRMEQWNIPLAFDHLHHERKVQLLRDLLRIQQGTVNEMKATLIRIYRNMTLKDGEISRLTKRVRELTDLKMGAGVEPQPVNLLEDPNRAEVEEYEFNGHIRILPEEVWQIILGMVTDRNDLWNLVNTCQLFNKLLRGWKTGHMLGQALPHLHLHLSGKKLLKCRLVCKSWETAVDTFLESHPSLRPHRDKDDPRHLNFINPMEEKELGCKYRLTQNSLKEYVGENADDLNIKFPSQPGRNPFIGRSCILHLSVEDGHVWPAIETVKGFWDRVHKFLIIYGKFIWYLKIWAPSYPSNHPMHERLVQFHTVDLFDYLPNLRKLTIKGELYSRAGGQPNGLEVAPTLEHIVLDLSWSHGFPQALIDQFRMQLRGLHFSNDFSIWEPLPRLEWPQLVELKLHGSFEKKETTALSEMRMPQLKKLVLRVENSQCRGHLAENILELIRNLCETTRLSVLRLEGGIKYLYKGWQSLDPRDRAPATLKTLEIDMDWKICTRPFTFLLRCFPHLENIFIDNVNVVSYDPSSPVYINNVYWNIKKFRRAQNMEEFVEVCKFAYGGNFYDSNIWELLTNLKVFSFDEEVYTRHCYEEHVNRKKNAASKNMGGT